MTGIIIGIVLAVIWAIIKGLATSGNKSAAVDYISSHGITVSKEIQYNIGQAMIANRIIVDDVAKKIYIFTFSNSSDPVCIPYDKLLGYEVFENAQSVGGLKRAVAGGILAGGVGAIVGSNLGTQKVTSMSFVIYQSDISAPQVTLPLIPNKDLSGYASNARDFCIEAGAVIKAVMDQQ